MSQRLHIGATDSTLYEAIIATEADATPENLKEWLEDGPQKIRIEDVGIWRKVAPIVEGLYSAHKGDFPNSIWAFYSGSKSLFHPNQSELDVWLDEIEKTKKDVP